MKNKSVLARSILLGSLFLGIMFNFFFLWKVPGLSLALYYLLAVLVLQLIKYVRDGKFTFKRVEYLYFPIFLIALVPFLTQNYTLNTLAVLTTMLTGTYVTIMTLWDIRLLSFSYIGMFLYTFFHQMIQIGFFFKPFMDLFSGGAKLKMDQTSKLALRILLGVALALPILLCFFILFLSADVAFGQLFAIDLDKIWDFFTFDRVWEIAILLFITAWWIGYMAAGVYFKFEIGKENNKLELKRFIDPVVSTVISVLLNILFFCFVIVQFVYLFAGEENIKGLNITYSDYARQGFFELVMVATLSLLVVYVLRKWGSFRSAANNLVLQFSLLLQIVFTFVILFSSYFRMSLYQNAYGFTDLRFFVFAFLIYLALVFLYLGVGVVYAKALRTFNLVSFILICLSFFVVAVINPDAYVAKANIAGHQNNSFVNKELDKSYLVYDLSSDSYSHFIGIEDFDEDKSLYCTITKQWLEESKHRSSFQELNLYRTGNVSKMQEALKDYVNEDGEVISGCYGEFLGNSGYSF